MSPTLSVTLSSRIAAFIVGRRRSIIVTAVLLTLGLAAGISKLVLEVAFDKTFPAHHPYMDVLRHYGPQFGHRDEVLVALVANEGDIYTPAFLARLEQLTNDLFFLPGVDRARVTSLFTPNVRFTEIVAGGFTGGPVLPDGFTPIPAMAEQLRINVGKSEQARLLVSTDRRAALVRVGLTQANTARGDLLDYRQVAAELDKNIRAKYSDAQTHVHILGFAPFMGEMTGKLQEVAGFFVLTIVAMAVILYATLRSTFVTLIPIACSLIALVWLLGLMGWFGLSITPVGVLVPFLVMAIGVSHGVQIANAFVHTNSGDIGAPAAALAALSRLLLPGALALLADVLGFATILLIDIPLVRELGLTATAGIALLLLCNLALLPCLLAVSPSPRAMPVSSIGVRAAAWLGAGNAPAASRRRAIGVVGAAALVTLIAAPFAARVDVGDAQRGAPELHADSRYNIALRSVNDLFSASIDTLIVYADIGADGCMNFAAMQTIDDVAAALRELPEVLRVRVLTEVAKVNNAGWHEGSLKWRALPRDSTALGEVVSPVQTSSGLLNHDCSVLPIYLDTIDHRATTIRAVLQGIDAVRSSLPPATVKLRLAGGNLAVLAATNDVVSAAQLPVIATIYAIVFIMCVLGFRSLTAAICIVVPLAMVSVLCYALMYALNIGLTPYTLPVVAVGAGIGVDYGLYLYAQYRPALRGKSMSATALTAAARQSMSAIIATCLTLTAGVLPWLLSGLKYQADMGLLLTFMFVVNMLAAILVMPALLAIMTKHRT